LEREDARADYLADALGAARDGDFDLRKGGGER
jgi:hypothetical protein